MSEANHSIAIEFINVSKVFPAMAPSGARPFYGLHETSFSIETGQFLCILGASGSGKTTLLKLINRLYEPTVGEIRIHGKKTAEIPLTELRRGMGYVIQQGGLFQHMTVARNIAIVPEISGWAKARIQYRVSELLELVGLEPDIFRNRYPRELSGGQQQRIGLARALAADPPILLMDEPFGAIDAITRLTLQEELLRLQKQLRKTVVFVTHDVQEALTLADRVMIMKEGCIHQHDTPSGIVAHPADDFVAKLLNTTWRKEFAQ